MVCRTLLLIECFRGILPSQAIIEWWPVGFALFLGLRVVRISSENVPDYILLFFIILNAGKWMSVKPGEATETCVFIRMDKLFYLEQARWIFSKYSSLLCRFLVTVVFSRNLPCAGASWPMIDCRMGNWTIYLALMRRGMYILMFILYPVRVLKLNTSFYFSDLCHFGSRLIYLYTCFFKIYSHLSLLYSGNICHIFGPFFARLEHKFSLSYIDSGPCGVL